MKSYMENNYFSDLVNNLTAIFDLVVVLVINFIN